MAHGCVYILLATVICYQPSTAEIGHLVPKDLSSSFKPLGASWRAISKDKTYYACDSDDWLQTTNELKTAGIQELTVKVVYKNSNKFLPINLNKTVFSLGVLTKNKNIDIFPANGILNKLKTNLTSTEFIPVNYPKLRVLIRSRDKSDCMIVYAVQITYRFCVRKAFFDVADFPKTFAPRNGTYPLKVEGNCTFGGKKIPVAYCNSNGEWTYNETLPCNCPSGQVMTSTGCVELSSIIREVKAIRLSNSRAKIFWKQKPKIQYDVLCNKCEDLKCDQKCPKTVRLEETKLTIPGENSSDITGLERGYDYLFTVVAKIKSFYENYWNETSKQVQLRALPEKVRNLTIVSQDRDRVVLTWLPPRNIDRARIIFAIGCRVYCVDEPCKTDRCKKLKFFPSRQNLLHTNVTITGFRNEGLLYVFEVTAKHRFYNNSEGALVIDWNFVAVNYTADFKERIETVPKSFNVVEVVIGVSVLIFAVIVTIVATRFYNRWKRRKHSLSFDCENAEPWSHCSEDNVPHSEMPLTDISTHYVDPSNYDSVENVLKKFTKKLNEKDLKTEAIIGEGEFGVVWKGYLEIDGEERTVAVKSLRSGLSAKLRRDFLAEASVMGQFKDPNVISLHGVVVKHNTVKIVMEFMSNGSLDQYLVENNGRLTTLQLLGMARGIASGMNYLSMRNFIHRDLAARNILVDENLSCKVSDFGLTREICQSSNYETSGGKIPIRWTAPEVIKHRKSFIASDVWSYGVVLWEIMSFGQRPYWEWDNFRVLQEIESGYRLPAPLKCPKTVHTLMLHCWEKERSNRPTFVHILNKLDEWIRSPETIHHSPATKARSNTCTGEPVEAQSPIDKWLNSIKMGKYAPNFTEAGYHQLSQITYLTEQDLSDMGITLVGHRHKIHQSIPLVK